MDGETAQLATRLAMHRLAIILPAYNEEVLLPGTLAALRQATDALEGWSCELVVVDNNSTDATSRIAREAGARVVFEPHNQIARARNAGASTIENADALVFVDADTRVPPALLVAAMRAMTEDDWAGGGAPLAFDQPLRPIGRLCLAAWTTLSRRLRWAAGSFIFVRADAFRDLGGFSERFYAGEEIDFSRRLRRWARRHGMRTGILPGPPAVTSGRKFDWHAPWKVAAIHLLLGLLPFLVFSRRWCGFWYRRPVNAPAPAPPGSETSRTPS